MRFPKFFLFIVILLIISIIPLSAQQINLKEELQWKDYILRGTLDNGLNYIILEHKKPEDRILIWLVVKTGSLLEKDRERGMAHFVEHMAFNGTKNFPPGELVKYFESIGVEWGGDLNAFTSYDRTAYMLQVPEQYLDKGLTAISDYAGSMSLMPEEVEKEKGIILEELRLGSDVDKRIYEKQIDIMFRGSIYPERLTIGIEDTIKKFNSDSVKNFYNTWYRPDNMTLIVIGDCKKAEVEDKIKSMFSQIPTSKGDKPNIDVPFKPYKDIATGIITDPELKESTLLITYLREPYKLKTLEDYKTTLCDSLIFQMINMRFNQEKYNKTTPIISAGSYNSTWLKDVCQTGVWASIKQGKGMEAIKTVMGYTEGIRQKGFSDIERQEAELELLESLRKSMEEKDSIESYSYADSIMDSIMHASVFTMPEQDYEISKKLLTVITNDELKKRINYLFEPVNMSVIIETPEKDRGNLNKDKILSITKEMIASGGIDYKVKKLTYKYDYSKLKPGTVKSKKVNKNLNITELKLSNGLTVLLKPTDFDKDTIIVNYTSVGGELLETPDTPGMSDVARLAWEKGGTEDLTQFQIERLLKGKNISFIPTGGIFYGISGSCAKSELEELCQWYWQYLVRPGYRKEAIDYAIKSLQEKIRTSSQYQETLMNEAEDSLLLQGNPLSFIAKEEDLAKYNKKEDLMKFQKLSCVPCNSEIVIVGNFDVEKAIPLICKYFGSISPEKKPDIPHAYFKTEFPQGNTKRIVYKGMEKRCLGNIIFPGCMKGDKDRPVINVLDKILDMRYNKKIREEKSLAYSVYSYASCPISIKGYGRIYVGFGTDPEKVDEVIKIALEEIEDIIKNGPTKEEVESAKNVLISTYEESLKENSYWQSHMLGSSLFNYDVELILKNKDRISTVTPEEVKDITKKYLNVKNNIILIALPEKSDK